MEEDRACLAYTSVPWSSLSKAREGAWRQKLEWRPRRNSAYSLDFPGFLSLFSYSAQGHLARVDAARSELGLSASIVNREKGPAANMMEVFPQLTFPFADDSSFCQVD